MMLGWHIKCMKPAFWEEQMRPPFFNVLLSGYKGHLHFEINIELVIGGFCSIVDEDHICQVYGMLYTNLITLIVNLIYFLTPN